jgi:hypothetical protein
MTDASAAPSPFIVVGLACPRNLLTLLRDVPQPVSTEVRGKCFYDC